MMDLLITLFEMLRAAPLPAVVGWTTVGNVVAFALALLAGHWLVARYAQHPITPPPPPLTAAEIGYAAACVVLNTVVTIAGVLLWQVGVIQVRYEMGWRVALDVVVLFLAMDLAMYLFHRVAHHPLVYRILHDVHHRFENPRPLTLFVLHPLEVLGFGALWLVVMTLYSASWLAIALYLTGNLAFGLVGHLGVEPLPRAWLQTPLLRLISTSTFHAEHHQDAGYNFGFYTVIWDRLFGTLAPDYTAEFMAASAPAAPAPSAPAP